MKTWGIYREPGAKAQRRRDRIAREFSVSTTPAPKRVAVIEADTQLEALEAFVAAERIRSSAVGEARYEWRGVRSGTSKWKQDDGGGRGDGEWKREWRVVLTITNGRNVHETTCLAWRADA